jgi:hypothetical protein
VAAGSRQIIAGVSGSLRSLGAMRAAADEARSAGAELLAVLAWAPAGGEIAYMRAPCPLLLRLWEQEACERLRDAFDQAFGGPPGGVAVRPLVVRPPPGPALVELADRRDDYWWRVTGGGADWAARSTARSPATAWRTRAARCWPCHRPN